MVSGWGRVSEKTRQFLKDNPMIAAEIEEKIRRNAGLLADEIAHAGMENR